MKIIKTLTIAIVALLSVVACTPTKQGIGALTLEKYASNKYFNIEVTTHDFMRFYENEGYSIHNVADINWPVSIDGETPTNLQRGILATALGDSTSTTIDEALRKYEKTPCTLSKGEYIVKEEADSASVNRNELFKTVTIDTLTANPKIIVFYAHSESDIAGAAHGVYSTVYVNYDPATKKTIGIDDIINDKEKLRKMLESKYKDDKESKDEEIFVLDEFPMAGTFKIETNQVAFIYQVYEIASYAEGAQVITLTYDDMNNAGLLTDYAKQLLR